MENALIVRRGTIEDLKMAMQIAEEVFKPTPEEKVRHHQYKIWKEKMENGVLVVGCHKNKLVGFALSYAKSTDFHIGNVGVVEEFRKKGLWKMMYEETLRFAVNNGYKSISLNTYKDKFPGMYNFCIKNGFEEISTEFDELSSQMKSSFLKKL
jgi:ribosomal protein S18 acetylase RimI-like enzyme